MSRRLLSIVVAPLAVVAIAVPPGAAASGAAASGVAGSATAGRCSRHLSSRLATFAAAHPEITFAMAVRELGPEGATYGYRRNARQRAASIVKVEILEALLHRYPGGLPAAVRPAARDMIERSDNSDAERLYDRVGRAAGLRRFGRLAGLQKTAPEGATGPGYAWGLTLTSPADQLRLLALLAGHNLLLSDADRHFAVGRMRHVESDQRWGVSAGTGRSRVALKNGWLPLRGGVTNWQINSIGFVRGSTGGYLIAIESHGADSMGRGVGAVDAASRLVARACS